MKRSSIVCQIALLAAVGCSGKVAPVADAPVTSESTPIVQTEENDTSMTFVSLKVPNMV